MKDCVNCWYHETYYTKCGIRFCREKEGKCSKYGKTTGNHETCDAWRWKRTEGEKWMDKRIAFKYVKKIASDLSMIAQILEEDCEGKNSENK